jgi:hypothetical protein
MPRPPSCAPPPHRVRPRRLVRGLGRKAILRGKPELPPRASSYQQAVLFPQPHVSDLPKPYASLVSEGIGFGFWHHEQTPPGCKQKPSKFHRSEPQCLSAARTSANGLSECFALCPVRFSAPSPLPGRPGRTRSEIPVPYRDSPQACRNPQASRMISALHPAPTTGTRLNSCRSLSR